MAQFCPHIVEAPDKLTLADDAAADAGAQGEEDHILHALGAAGSGEVFAEGRGVGVIFQDGR